MRKKGNWFIRTGLLLLTAALFLAAYNTWDGIRADRSAQSANAKLQQAILEAAASGEPAQAGEELPEAGFSEPGSSETEEAGEEGPGGEMPSIELDGDFYIGVLEIPSLGLSLPIMAECDYTKLRTAPCRYSGSYYTDDLVIAGHNYPKHFSPIKWIESGSDVLFTTARGEVLAYTVDWVETMRPTEIEKMVSAGDWDLTLFTCTTGGNARCAVRCVRVK